MGEVTIEEVSLSFTTRRAGTITALSTLNMTIPDQQFAVYSVEKLQNILAGESIFDITISKI